jgi:phosphoribosylamine-glycine ligase
MKFLLVSKSADTLSLAMRLEDEGNEVEFAILDPKLQRVGEGLVTKVDWRKALAKDKIIIFDMVGSGATAAQLRKQGYVVFGSDPVLDRIELNREFGTQSMNVAGIKTPKTEVFNDFDTACQYVKERDCRLVFKPNDNMATALTYVGYNAEDMIHYLQNISKSPEIKKGATFSLQDFTDGVEVSLEGMFNGTEWVDGWWNITFERKRKMGGDLGHNTGCALDVVRVLPDQIDTPAVQKTLKKITPLLRGVKGVVDINCIWKNAVPLGLEFTARFGINAIFTMLELVKDEIGKIIADCALGTLTRVSTDKMNFGASVRTGVPSKPYVPRRLIQNIQNFKHIHPLDMMVENGKLVCADTDFALCIVTAFGTTITKAADFVYHIIDKTERFGILDLEYRLDCGDDAEESYAKIKSWGLLK